MTPKIYSFLTSLIVILLTPMVANSLAGAKTFSVVFTFTDPSQGFMSQGPLLTDTAGNLYGTASDGGANNNGTVYKVYPSGILTVLHSFPTGTFDGDDPMGGLVMDNRGTHVYGVTYLGGNHRALCGLSGCGIIFRVTPTGEEQIVYRFGEKDGLSGSKPQVGLIADPEGDFYGTATFGGTNGTGVVFRLSKWTYTVLHNFGPAYGGGDGAYPQGPLLRDSAGNLYGTTGFGGQFGDGTVFKIDTAGNESVLYSFTGGADGTQPYNNLVRDFAGNLYGTTISSQDLTGTIFKLHTSGKLTVLYTFASVGTFSNGIVRDDSGNIYGGTTPSQDAFGTLFKLDTSGNMTVLHTFTGGADGGSPGNLVMDAAGNIYGPTLQGGDLNCAAAGGGGCGVIFKLTR
jgi:uncharacterized repeat protein (TIGR03803 family)